MTTLIHQPVNISIPLDDNNIVEPTPSDSKKAAEQEVIDAEQAVNDRIEAKKQEAIDRIEAAKVVKKQAKVEEAMARLNPEERKAARIKEEVKAAKLANKKKIKSLHDNMMTAEELAELPGAGNGAHEVAKKAGAAWSAESARQREVARAARVVKAAEKAAEKAAKVAEEERAAKVAEEKKAAAVRATLRSAASQVNRARRRMEVMEQGARNDATAIRRDCNGASKTQDQLIIVKKAFHAEDCPICFNGIKETNVMTLRCGHQTCGDCLFHHFQTIGGTKCPVCREQYVVRVEGWKPPAPVR